MNFYNENEEEKKDGAPVLPRAASPFKKTSAFGKSPMFSRAAGGIMDRLKNLSRRDMALVGLGLSVLVMVPTAEYMMSQPTADNVLSGGFGSKGEGLNSGSGPYEPGVNGLSQGSADGNGEVITPLSSRDPVSLILGSQPAQAAAAPVAYTPPATSMRDAMKDAGRAAFSAASQAAGAPTVIPRMAAAMRSMSFFTGGESSRTSGGVSDGKIIQDAKSASSKAAKRSMLGPVAIAGYKGVANTPNGSSKGAFEKLRAEGDKSAGNFNGDSAVRSLDKAAADALDIGKGAGGMGSGGEDSDKTGKPSNSTTKNESNVSGECNTLTCQMDKQRAQKALDWEMFKKYEIPKQIINAVVGAVSGVLGDFVKSNLTTALGMDSPASHCWQPTICPNGGDACTNVAIGLWGPYSAWRGSHKVEELCADGVVDQKTSVGDKSATSLQTSCVCGRAATPTSGVAAAGGTTGGTPGGGTPGGGTSNPGNNSSSTPPQHAAAAVANVKDYDGILQDIVNTVADTEANPKKADDNLKGVAGGFQNLSPKAKGNINMLGNLRDGTESALSDFNKRLSSSQSKMAGVQPKYDAFNTQLEKLKADLGTDKVAMKTTGNIQASLPPESKAKVQDVIKQWSDTGVTFYNSADGNLEAERKWGGAFSSQLPPIRKGIETISQAQNEIDTSWSQIYGQTDLSSIGKLKKLSDRLKDVQESTAPATNKDAGQQNSLSPLQQTAVKQRGLDWDKLWNGKTHEMNATKISEAEVADFKTWVDAVGKATGSSAIPVTPTVPSNFINNQMRSTQVKSTILGQMPNFDAIDKDLDSTSAALDAVRNALLGYGVDPSYFPGGSAPVVPSSSTGTVTPTNNPDTPAVDSTLSGRRTTLLASANLAGNNYAAATAVQKNLGSGTNAQYARADYRNMTASKTEIDRLNAELSAPNAKVTKDKLDELNMHLKNFNKAYTDFQGHAASAPVVHTQPQVVVNNNVSANATAGANLNNSTTVKPTVNNNTAVKPTIVNNNTSPKPTQPVTPLPSAAKTEFSLGMSGGVFMKVSTGAGNTGKTAVYYGSYRQSTWDFLYKYEVRCARSTNTGTFKITGVQRTKALFTTGLTVGGAETVSGYVGQSCE